MQHWEGLPPYSPACSAAVSWHCPAASILGHGEEAIPVHAIVRIPSRHYISIACARIIARVLMTPCARIYFHVHSRRCYPHSTATYQKAVVGQPRHQEQQRPHQTPRTISTPQQTSRCACLSVAGLTHRYRPFRCSPTRVALHHTAIIGNKRLSPATA